MIIWLSTGNYSKTGSFFAVMYYTMFITVSLIFVNCKKNSFYMISMGFINCIRIDQFHVPLKARLKHFCVK